MNDDSFARINCPQDPPCHLRPIYGNLRLEVPPCKKRVKNKWIKGCNVSEYLLSLHSNLTLLN
jgi:hypothetical protein